jgi:hypothetical protein
MLIALADGSVPMISHWPGMLRCERKKLPERSRGSFVFLISKVASFARLG